MAQPRECFLLKLPHPFAAEAHLLPQFLQRARRFLSQTMPPHDHLAQTFGKLTNQIVKDVFDDFPLQLLSWVRQDPRA